MADQGSDSALLWTPKITAKQCGDVCPRTLWKWTFETNPPLPHVKIGRLVMYRPRDVEQWIDSQLQGGVV
jgi:hypothetical protein